MAKINLRNRIRENNEDNNPQASSSVPLFNKIEKDEPALQQPENVSQNFYTQEQPSQNNYYQTPEPVKTESQSENIRKRSAGLFRDEESTQNQKGFTGLLKGTKKLFAKSLDNLPNSPKNVLDNFLDKFNVNRRMLYIAVGTSSIAAILALNYLNSFTAGRLFGSQEITVLVATKDIREKSIISMNDFVQIPIPAKFVIPNTIVVGPSFNIKDYVGRVAITDIYKGEQISTKRIVKEEQSPWISPFIPANHRAFDIPTKSLSYIKPRDHVDILVSVPHPIDKRKIINTPVLQNADVMAVDGRYKVSPNDPPVSGDRIMIAVPNKLVHLFTLLQERGGNFQVIMRSDGDVVNLDEKVSIDKLELMFADNNNKVESVKIDTPKPKKVKPVFVEPPVQVYNPPPPVYNPPAQVYNPPPRAYNPPPKKVKVVKQAPKKETAHTTVTVINGTNVQQDNVATDKKEEKKE